LIFSGKKRNKKAGASAGFFIYSNAFYGRN